ncbi:MAG: hypothetical protein WAL63_03130 [Solirubrobacteraceae bacterium]
MAGLDAHWGAFVGECPEGEIDDIAGAVAKEADPDDSRLGLGGGAGDVDGMVGRSDGLPGGWEQLGAGGGERDVTAGALKQRHAQVGFEGADGLAQGRLGDVKPLGGASEVQLVGDGDEVAQLREGDP